MFGIPVLVDTLYEWMNDYLGDLHTSNNRLFISGVYAGLKAYWFWIV